MSDGSQNRQRMFGLAMVALTLFAIEVGFRVVVAIRTGPRALAYGVTADRAHLDLHRHDDDRSGYSKYFPHQELRDRNPDTGESFVTRVNAAGFRGGDFGPKPPDVVRVVTLGASSTFGHHVKDAQTYPARLEARLRERCPAMTWEVLNLGIPHLMSDEIATLFEAEGLALQPDIVTFYEGANDATPRRTRHATRRRMRRIGPLRTVYRILRDHVLVVRFLDDTLRPRVTTHDAAAVAAHLDGVGEEFFLALDRIRTLCQENGIRFVICRQQAKSLSVRRDDLRGLTYAQERERVQQTLDADGELPPPSVWFLAHARIMERVPEWAERTGAGYADGIGALDENRDQLLSWVHLSPRGNEILADTLADELLRAFTVPCETPTESDR